MASGSGADRCARAPDPRQHVTALAGLPALHKGPFDRALIAQAKAEGPLTSPLRDYSVQTIQVVACADARRAHNRTEVTSGIGTSGPDPQSVELFLFCPIAYPVCGLRDDRRDGLRLRHIDR